MDKDFNVKDLVKMAQRPFLFMSVGSFALTLIALGVFAWFGSKYYINNEQYKKDTSHQLELLNQHYVINNQQTVLLKVLDGKLPNLPIDTKVQLAKIIYDMSQLKQVPISIICGLAEVESQWTPDIVSPAGAQGLIQVMPIYARPYLREKGLNYKPDIFKDPVINVMVGISMLRDFQDEHVERGRTDGSNWTFALHTYLWGPSNSNQIFGKTDQRVNVPNMAYPQRVLDAAKKYKDMGL